MVSVVQKLREARDRARAALANRILRTRDIVAQTKYKYVDKPSFQMRARGVQMGTSPLAFGGAGIAARAPGFISKTIGKIAHAAKVAQGGGGLAGFSSRFYRGLGAAAGTQFVASAITGEDPQIGARTLLGASGFAVGGVPGLVAGSLIGAGDILFESVASAIASIPAPQLPPEITIDIPAIQQTVPDFNFIYPETGGLPDAGFSGSIAGGIIPSAPGASVSVGGGGIDPGTLALLVALIGGGGYLLGRKKRRRKKKKYKKKARRY